MNNFVKLGDIAHIEISNVDKKSKAGEDTVKLCNFVDVYHEWAITQNYANNLMLATASKNAISKYSIHKGDVAITKDSETRDDIGVATYIADEISDCVLGYHCALIQPNVGILNGKYLNVVLHTNYAQRYFEANASGSGQRYTLTNQIIEDFLVPMYPFKVQEKIGNTASYIDRKIENNNLISFQLESMAKTIYEYWFLQFDFPDENGKPYKSSGGKMVWNEELKREIPEGWKCKKLKEISELIMNSINPSDNPKTIYIHYSIPAYDDYGYPISECGEEINSGKYIVPNNSILVSKLNPQFKRIWEPLNYDSNSICSTEFMPFIPKKAKNRSFLYSTLNSDIFQSYMIQCSSSSTGSRKRMQPELCGEYKFAYPDSNEMIIEDFCNIANGIQKKKQNIAEENHQLISLRDFLLPMLMNGQVTFKEQA